MDHKDQKAVDHLTDLTPEIQEYYSNLPTDYLTQEIYKYILPPKPLLLNKQETSVVQSVSNPLLKRDISAKSARELVEELPKQSLCSFLSDKSKIVYSRPKLTIPELLKPAKPPRVGSALAFDSKFESGNLETAIKVSESEYNLVLQNDVNSSGHTQWFYFRVFNTLKDQQIKFNIVNLGKKDSLFNHGMRILVYSAIEKRWFRSGSHISYFKNNIFKDSGKSYYTLTFSFQFPHSSDVISFAYSLPYTYLDLQKDLKSLESKKYVRRSILCNTVGGVKCEYLTISTDTGRRKKGVVISARVHPGESVSSWMMKGLLEFLTGNSSEAALLRETYVFKIIPMLNPDGVICGNYRCGLSGCDLNRRWAFPSSKMQPTIFYTKKLVKDFCKERRVEVICDLHGHSRRKGVFMYGCSVPGNPEATRTLPLVLSKLSPAFEYKYCCFRMQKSKESTMRITLFKETNVNAVYTLEASFFGSVEGQEFDDEVLKQIGSDFPRALLSFNNYPAFSEKEMMSVLDEGSSGSDSDPSEDNIELEVQEVLPPKPRQVKPRLMTSNRSLSAHKSILKKKCPLCGSFRENGHSCSKKIPQRSQQGQLPYYNAKGKLVKDQKIQTEERGVFKDVQKSTKKMDFASLRKSWGQNATPGSFKMKIESFARMRRQL